MYPSYYKKGNWGRWGADDERGALNLITPDVIANAARLVKRGKCYTLGLPIRHNAKDSPTWAGRVPPVHIALFSSKGPNGFGGGDDYLVVNTHNTPTHIDALAHFWMANRLYNNFPDSVVSAAGAKRCGIDKVGAIVTRGVLLDMARYKGVHHLEPGEVISAEDLERCAESQGVEFESGDAILVRTNFPTQFNPEQPEKYFEASPGVGMSVVDLMDRIGAVAIGSDAVFVEVHPSEVKGKPVPLHEELLWRRGIYFFEFLNLEPLAADKVYEFLLVVSPLEIEGGLGSPINPVAIA